MGYAIVNVDDIAGRGLPGRWEDGMTFVGVGARRGSYEPRGPF